MEKVSNVERQLFILKTLADSKRGCTVQELIDLLEKNAEIEATRRSVRRDIDFLSLEFCVSESDEKRNGHTVYTADKYELKEMDFSVSELVSLYFAKQILSSYSSLGIATDAIEIMDKILGKFPSLSQKAMEHIYSMIKIVPDHVLEENVNEDILDIVKQATLSRKRLRIAYAAFDCDEIKMREFDPYTLEIREGFWHAIGHCYLRDEIRDLRVSRMKSAEILETEYTVPVRFYEEYRRTRFDKLAGKDAQEIEILFLGASAKLVCEFHAHKADRLTHTKEGVLFQKRAAITPDFVGWLLSFGAGARVVAPEALKQRVYEEVKNVAEIYQ